MEQKDTSSSPKHAVQARPSTFWNRLPEATMELLIRFFGWSAVLSVLAIFFFIIREAAPVLPVINWKEFFTVNYWHPGDEHQPHFGAMALIVGNLLVAILAMIFAIPLGLGAAVYVSEFAGPKTRETLKVAIELLAAVPSIVWGFVGLTIISPLLVKLTGAPIGINLLNGAIILALMAVPLIVSLSEDALRAVPDSYREAAIALGANKWETVYRVLFPAGKNGLMAACMLGVGRAVGETMAVLLATGNTAQIPRSLMDPIKTMTATIAGDMSEAAPGGMHYRSLFVLGIVLLTMTCLINLIADRVIRGGKKTA